MFVNVPKILSLVKMDEPVKQIALHHISSANPLSSVFHFGGSVTHRMIAVMVSKKNISKVPNDIIYIFR